MDRAVVGSDHQFSIRPLGVFVSADQKLQGELFEAEAAAGVPHGQIRESTAGDIRAGGGNVEVKPERTRSGTLNPKHVDVMEGKSTFGPVKPNPVPKKDRIQ